MAPLQARWHSATPSTRSGEKEHAASNLYHTAEKPLLPLRYVVYLDFKAFFARWRKYKLWIGAASLAIGTALAWFMYRSLQPAVVANNLVGAFEKGSVPDDYKQKDAAATLRRDVLHMELQQLLRPKDCDLYALVVGAHGTGKVSDHTPQRALLVR